MKDEIWKDIKGYEDLYQISSHGRVKRKNGIVERVQKNSSKIIKQPIKEKILKGTKNPVSNYPTVSLCKKGVCEINYRHTLVAKHFLPDPPEDVNRYQVCHNDGNPENPYYKNLRYDTPKGNALDRHKHGTDAKGENNPLAKLTENQVALFKSEIKNSTIKSACKKLNIGYSNGRLIKAGKRWCWVKPSV